MASNGASLEDCRTNVFILTELNGLKWRKFIAQTSIHRGSSTDIDHDQILRAYGRCLSDGMLCVWRRSMSGVQQNSNRVDIRLDADKELWVFWMNNTDEPDNLAKYTKTLNAPDDGRDSCMNDINYDTRLLLFKALHNQIERCFLSKGYLRFSKWFTQPFEQTLAHSSARYAVPRFLLAFNFSFFVHNDNNVCVTVNVQRQPVLHRLTRCHLEDTISPDQKQRVLLSPFNLKATLVGIGGGSTAVIDKHWHDWLHFYPLLGDTDDNTENMGFVDPIEKERQDRAKAAALPKKVLVNIDGADVWWPSCYVVVVADEDHLWTATQLKKIGASTADYKQQHQSRKRKIDTASGDRDDVGGGGVEQQQTATGVVVAVSGARVMQRCAEEIYLCANDVVDDSRWNYVDAARREDSMCACNTMILQQQQQQHSATPPPPPPLISKAAHKFGVIPLPPPTSHRKTTTTKSTIRTGAFHRRSAKTKLSAEQSASSDNATTTKSTIDSIRTPPTIIDCYTPLPLSIQPASSSSNSFNFAPIAATNNCSTNIAAIYQNISPVASSRTQSPMSEIIANSSSSSSDMRRQQQQQHNTELSAVPSSSSGAAKSLHSSDNLSTTTTEYRSMIDSATRNIATNSNVSVATAALRHQSMNRMKKNRRRLPPQLHQYDYSIIDNSDSIFDVNQESIITCWSNVKGRRRVERSDIECLSTTEHNHIDETIIVESTTTPPPIQSVSSSSFTQHHFKSESDDYIDDRVSKTISNDCEMTTTTNGSNSMPDNILDQSPILTTILSTALSPPASNEQRVDQQIAPHTTSYVPPTSLNTITGPQQYRTTGPPSVEYTKIYPTPPSIDLNHSQQFSPLDALPLADHFSPPEPICEQSSLSTVAHHLPIRQQMIAVVVSSSLPLVTPVCIANYINSNKFFGKSSLKSHSMLKSAIVPSNYKPSQNLKIIQHRNLPNSLQYLHQMPNFNGSGGGGSSSIFPPPQQLFYARPSSQHIQQQYGHQQQQRPPLFASIPYNNNNSFMSTSQSAVRGAIRTPNNMIMPSQQQHMPIDIQQSPAGPPLYMRNTASVEGMQQHQQFDLMMNNNNDGAAAAAKTPEMHGLVLTLLLSDTVFDLHYDASFDSCPICSCSSNIRSSEFGMYLTPPPAAHNYHNNPLSGFYGAAPTMSAGASRCKCGFSAVRHRYLSENAGLFDEDSEEAIGIARSRLPSRARNDAEMMAEMQLCADAYFINLLRHQTLVRHLAPTVTAPAILDRQIARALSSRPIGNDVTAEYIYSDIENRELSHMIGSAMESASMVMDCVITPKQRQSSVLHRWGQQLANTVAEPTEFEWLALLNEIKPILENAIIQAPPCRSAVDGPLTWRHFERRAYKSSSNSATSQDDDCQPEPIPQILVSQDRDALSISPQALRLWERLMLEPYDHAKDVMYISVVPDNSLIADRARVFFYELSKMYDNCRFGRHLKCAKDIRIGSHMKTVKVEEQQQQRGSDWLDTIEANIDDKVFHARLKSFARQCEQQLMQILENDNLFDRQAFKDALIREHQQPSTLSSSRTDAMMPPPAVPGSTTNNVAAVEAPVDGAGADGQGGIDQDGDSNNLPHVLVVYIVNPFNFGADHHDETSGKVSTTALLKSFLATLKRLDKRYRPYVQFELIQLQTIFDCTAMIADQLKDERGISLASDSGCDERRLSHQQQRLTASDVLKSIAISVYSQPRCLLPMVLKTGQAKSMTKFGPAAATLEYIDRLCRCDPPTIYKIPSTPYILAPIIQQKSLSKGVDLLAVQPTKEDSVLFVSYCLAGRDRQWLVAAVTDQRGHLLDNCLINIHSQQRPNVRFKNGSQIKDSLERLWQFILGVLSTGCRNWRLVVGRLGRIGHGEFKTWAHLLSKPNLKRYSQQLKDRCQQCQLMPTFQETPSLLSACLVSTEPEPHLRLFPSSVAPDERLSKSSKQHRSLRTPDDTTCTHILVFPTSADIQFDHGGQRGIPNIEEDDGFQFPDLTGDCEELQGNFIDDILVPPSSSAPNRGGTSFFFPTEMQENIDNQPLAVGYSISTAPASDLPHWFWRSSAAARHRCPVHLKSSLHLNTPNVQANDDQLTFGSSRSTCAHALDTTRTDDVLKYVLETFNALSWLNIDLVSGERRSCLPIHVQALLRLCNTVDRLL